MAADGWGRDAVLTVEEALFAEGHRFDFFQAVSLLEALHHARHASPTGDAAGSADSVGEGREAGREAVRFQSNVGFAFPPGEVGGVFRAEREGEPCSMVVTFMSLVGGLGPMPEPLADLVMRSAVNRDPGPADFLDVFHHRLVSLRYRVRKRHRIALGVRSPDRARMAAHLFAFAGLFAPATDPPPGDVLRRRQRDGGRPLLHYAGLLAGEVRSMAGLTSILRHRFGVPVEGVSLTGSYRSIDDRDRTRIGRSGQNRRLGDSAVIGRRAWDQQGAFELRVGDRDDPEPRRQQSPPRRLDHATLLRLLPGGDGNAAGDMLAPLCEIVRFYAGDAIDFTLRLAVDREAAHQTALGGRARLGYTAWLGRRREDARSLEVCIPSNELRAAEV